MFSQDEIIIRINLMVGGNLSRVVLDKRLNLDRVVGE